jgi:hypothetical protein
MEETSSRQEASNNWIESPLDSQGEENEKQLDLSEEVGSWLELGP